MKVSIMRASCCEITLLRMRATPRTGLRITSTTDVIPSTSAALSSWRPGVGGTMVPTVSYGGSLRNDGTGEPMEAAAWATYANGKPDDPRVIGTDAAFASGDDKGRLRSPALSIGFVSECARVWPRRSSPY
jgi:hypothetical protein